MQTTMRRGNLLLCWQLLSSFLLLMTVMGTPVKYTQCKLRVEGVKGDRKNPEPSISVSLECSNGESNRNGGVVWDRLLSEQKVPAWKIGPDVITAPGTPISFFHEDGGLVHISNYEDETFVLYDSWFTSLNMPVATAPLVIENARVKLVNCKFSGNEMRRSGGVLLDTPFNYIPDVVMANYKKIVDEHVVPIPLSGPMVQFENCFFEHLGSGAINIDSFPYVHVKNTEFLGNRGAAVHYRKGSTLVLDNSLIDSQGVGKKEGDTAGGVVGYGGVAFLARSTRFRDNYMYRGGAIQWVDGTGLSETILHLSSCTFGSNGAMDGGAVHTTGSFTMVIEDSIFDGNVAESNGGSIYLQGDYEISVNSTTLMRGKAASGGVIYADYAGFGDQLDEPLCNALFFQDSLFDSNTAEFFGGAVYVRGNDLAGVSMCNTKFQDNAVMGDGGGVYLTGVPDAYIENSEFVGNALKGERHSGAGIYANSVVQMQIKNSRFQNNSALEPKCEEPAIVQFGGGAIYLKNSLIAHKASRLEISESHFDSNHAQEGGGDLSISTVHNVIIKDSQFSNGLAHKAGSIEAMGVANMLMENVHMVGNEACGWDGGAMHVYESVSLSILKSLFANNTATRATGDGGVLKLREGGTVTIGASDFLSNSAGAKSGALDVMKVTSLTLNDCLFDSNEASFAGAVRASQIKGKVLVSVSTFKNNRARDRHGGTIETDTVENLELVHSHFYDGHAETTGGALHSRSTDNVTISNCDFRSNSAEKGGSIYGRNVGSMIFENSNIAGSKSRADGGAMYLTAVKKFEGKVSVIEHSEAKGNGAGIFMRHGDSAEISHLNVGHNEAHNGSGIYMDRVDEVVIKDGEFYENHAESAGGAMSIRNADSVEMAMCKLLMNSADEAGGMLLSDVGAATVKSTQFEQNKAVNGGGAGFLARNVPVLTGDGLTFLNNEASIRGAVGALLMQGKGRLSLADISIKEGSKLAKNQGTDHKDLETEKKEKVNSGRAKVQLSSRMNNCDKHPRCRTQRPGLMNHMNPISQA